MDRLHRFWLIVVLLPLAGCFSERSFPMRPERLHLPATAQVTGLDGQRLNTRQWAAAAHGAAASCLPDKARQTLFSDTVTDAHGQVVDIYRHFDLDEQDLDSIFGNWSGLEQTAQVSSPPTSESASRMWEGFTEVSVPVSAGLTLYGRLGMPRPADEIPGSYVIVVHGLFGSLAGFDMENHVQGLRRAGHHVLAVELRGHGLTGKRRPDAAMTFGLRESADLLAAAQWLKAEHHAQRVGLLAFSLSGFESLQAAWLDAAPLAPADARRPILRFATPPPHEPAFNGGMFIVSVVPGLDASSDAEVTHWTWWSGPCKASFQQRAAERLESYGEPAPRTAWEFMAAELRRDGWGQAYPSEQALRADVAWFQTRGQDHGQTAAGRLEMVRTPVLILSAANDPLDTAQDVAELLGRVRNPNVGLIMLGGGGHMGFPAYCADYYYSLVRAFFDPTTAPRPASRAGGGA